LNGVAHPSAIVIVEVNLYPVVGIEEQVALVEGDKLVGSGEAIPRKTLFLMLFRPIFFLLFRLIVVIFLVTLLLRRNLGCKGSIKE